MNEQRLEDTDLKLVKEVDDKTAEYVKSCMPEAARECVLGSFVKDRSQWSRKKHLRP
jgi:hypothetical protein